MTSKKSRVLYRGILSLALLSLSLPASAQIWSNPSAAPTGGNTASPLNVSSNTQTKTGALFVGGLRSSVDLIADGKVGIGVAAPEGKLHIVGATAASVTDPAINIQNNRIVSWFDSAGAKTNGGFVWFDSSNRLNLGAGNNTRLTITSSGGVGIGTQDPGVYKLNVSGSAAAQSFFYTSDEKLKDDIRPLEGSLGKVLGLQGVSFSWKEGGEKSVGLVAQDVEEIYPELVSTTDEGIKSVQYGNLVAPLIEAIKEQQKEIEALRSEVRALKEAR